MQHIVTDYYEIFHNSRCVIVYSIDRLKLEPKGWQIELRHDVRNAIEQLCTAKDECVIATYGVDNDKGFVDTENALFYNMGTAAFRRIASCGIAFDTLPADETNQLLAQAGKPQYHHYYSYQIGRFSRHVVNPLLSWEKMELFPLRGEHKPFEYWKLLRERIDEIEVFHKDDCVGPFGIELHFYEPELNAINLANPMKTLLDGIICAFHRMPNDIDENFLSNVCARLGLPKEKILCEDKTILGAEIFVKPYRENVVWNPQDDRCLSVSMRIEYGTDNRCFSGKIFQM